MHGCGRWQKVVRTRSDCIDVGRLEAITKQLRGTIRYRGFRIDLLSFKTLAGWRPLAVVKSERGARVPDMPAMVWGLMPTKADADELAGNQTRVWIDKHFVD